MRAAVLLQMVECSSFMTDSVNALCDKNNQKNKSPSLWNLNDMQATRDLEVQGGFRAECVVMI